MINRQEIERLLKSDSGIVSVYLRITPRLGYDRSFPATQFKGALKRTTGRLKHEQWRQAGARVETLYGEARDRLMTAGGIGALLRY